MRNKIEERLIKIKSKTQKLIAILIANGIIILSNQSVAYAKWKLDLGVAKPEVQNFCKPFAELMLYASLPITLACAGWSYVTWTGKDEEEKENMPYVKIFKKQLISYGIYLFSTTAFNWFVRS